MVLPSIYHVRATLPPNIKQMACRKIVSDWHRFGTVTAMKDTQATSPATVEAIDSAFMLKIFYCFVALAGFSIIISLAGKQFGGAIVRAGHTNDTTVHEIVIGNNVLSVAANEIRMEHERRAGVTSRLDTYVRWPSLSGYTKETRDDFNHVGLTRNIIFVSFRERTMSRDMSGRLAPIYNSLITKPGIPGPGGTILYGFKENSGYLNEILAVAGRGQSGPFVARCLTGDSAGASLAPCERDVHIGNGLSMTYRFPDRLLAEWKLLDAKMATYAADRLKAIK